MSRPGTAYKAVIFDLGNVLVHFDFRPAYEALERLCPYRAAEIRARLAPTGLVQRLETGLVEPREFVAELERVLDLRIGYDEFRHIWFSIFSDALVPESMLVGLKARYRLLLLSNTNALHFEMLREHYPLLRHFDHLILSYEVKAMKPQPQIFQAAVACAGCLPEECFYTDDIAEYVQAARRLGIDAVRFESAAQLQAEMRARGIRWE